MADAELTCALHLTPTVDGDIGLAFAVRNPGTQPVEIQFYRPFSSFDLAVQADDGALPVIQPAYNVAVRPHTATIAPGAALRIETPIQLRFDPQVPPSGGDVPTRWSLPHLPVAVRVRATLRLSGASIAPCEARFDPHAARR
ncbi:MAG TPA: hypothetical protein VKY74_05595 [Chloroflexia bacterium]|nr:hypothetical protein [Chloroflexia bacterium]